MSVRVLAAQIGPFVGETITVQGWVHRFRKLGKIAFLVLRDRSGQVQCVLQGTLAGQSVSVESVVTVTGKVAGASDSFELQVESFAILSEAQSLPFEVNQPELAVQAETMYNHRALSLRHSQHHAIFKVQSALVGAFREFLVREGFTQIFTPKIVASGTEGGSNLFPIQYFEQQAYLAQSPQFYKQMMVGAGYERVFEIAPVYRAEEHNTSRHLNEYLSLDVEMGFIQSEQELMALETRLLRHMFSAVAATCAEELALHAGPTHEISEIPQFTVAEAQEILERRFGKSSPAGDLDGEGERLLCSYVKRGNAPALAFLTRYPSGVRPMYAMPAPENPALTASFDLLMEGLEITTGGQRIHQYGQLVQSIAQRGMELSAFEGYLDIFRYGMPPHGGFAIGLERLTAKLLGLSNVREASAFPRDRTRLAP